MEKSHSPSSCRICTAIVFILGLLFFQVSSPLVPMAFGSTTEARADAGLDQVVNEGVLVTLDGKGSRTTVTAIDQAQERVWGNNNLNNIHRFAQTFAVGQTGTLAGIDLYIWFLGNDPDATVSIQRLDINGLPDDSAILGTTSLSGPSLIGSSPRPYYFDLSHSNILVSRGDNLAIVISSTDQPWVTGDVAVLYWGYGDSYPFGEEYRTWDTSNGQPCRWCNNGGGGDIYFRTYVETDQGSESLKFDWRQVAGQEVSLDDPSSVTPNFYAPILSEDQTLTFELAVSDLNGTIARDTVDVTVINSNNAPVADAGENLTLQSDQVVSTSIHGTGTDPDGDNLLYRWLESETVLLDWTDVSPNGDCLLDLSTVSLPIGTHTLILEVSDREATAFDDMILTIENSTPHAALTGGAGTYELGADIILSGEATDFDGDSLLYHWIVGENVYCFDNVSTVTGGTPVSVPDCNISGLPLGEHIAYLQVSDGINPAVASEVAVLKIIDEVAPTLAPVANRSILWPPNHTLVDISIDPRATDNSGLRVTLSAVISSDEPHEGLGDGDIAPDWEGPWIDPETGVVTLKLRAERSGAGNGREYTVAVTAKDSAGNSSTANLVIIVPHDQKKK